MDEETIFAGVIDLPDEQQASFLSEACGDNVELRGRVEALLHSHREAADDFLQPELPEGVRQTAIGLVEASGTRIGRYKLLQQIGEGGFGVVYMAEQEEPVRREVALKIIKPGMDTKEVVARFEAERQALALMDHPHIAHVLDGGATESGRPYFVMELVRGVPLTEFCDNSKLATDERLRLFNSVCKAIQHAHHKGVIHRDLKPSNVMITLHDGVPIVKVIDFGVAKAIHQRLTEKTMFTSYGQMIGTPQYMSPEQAEMSGLDIDTRSDVYSLGVLLYELLTGETPLNPRELRETTYAEIQRRIREDEPLKPSTRLSTTTDKLASVAAARAVEPGRLCRMLRGELDWIVMRALEKDRARRYGTASGLARDIERYLANEPVEAGPPSVYYLLKKFAGRHRALLTTAAAFVALLLAGIAVSTWLAISLGRERDAVIDEQARTRKLEQQRQIARLDALAVADPAAVPVLLVELAVESDAIAPELRDRFDAPATSADARLRFAMALAALNEPPLDFLVDSVATAPSRECSNLIAAMRKASPRCIDLLSERHRSNTDVQTRFRYAVVLMELGAPAAIEGLLRLQEDPATRVWCIHHLSNWHGDLTTLPEILRSTQNSALRSGLCLALGLLSPDSVVQSARSEIERELTRLFVNARSGAAHSAARWAMRRWGLELPDLPDAPADETRKWFENPQGMTMVVLPPGASLSGYPRPTKLRMLPYSFAIADRETSITAFRTFLDDPDYPDTEKPDDWPGIDSTIAPSDSHPVHNVNLRDAFLFCNWLSRREGRDVCYEAIEDGPSRWACHYRRNGYRLPTRWEWEYACRAGTTTVFPFGDDPDRLPDYANVLQRRARPSGRHLPNDWGLFDMLANQWDISFTPKTGSQLLEIFPPRVVVNDSRWLIQGGTYGTGSFYSYSSSSTASKQRTLGSSFRVVCRQSEDFEFATRSELQQTSLEIFDTILQADPSNDTALVQRATVYLERCRWTEAAADYRRLVELQPRNSSHWFEAATVALYAGEHEEYRRLCELMLGRFESTSTPVTADRVAKACLLTSDAVEDVDAVFQLARNATSRDDHHWAGAYFRTLRGLVDYRAGRFKDAIATATENRDLISGQPYLAEVNLMILSLARHAAGEHANARRQFESVAASLDGLFDQACNGEQLVAGWQDLLIADILRREAAGLMGDDTAGRE